MLDLLKIPYKNKRNQRILENEKVGMEKHKETRWDQYDNSKL